MKFDSFNFYDFPKEEYLLRQGKAAALMKEHKLDALLISDDINIRYLTGYVGPTKNRPGVVIFTKEGETALLADGFGAQVAHFTTFEKAGLRPYDLPFTYNTVKSALSDLKLGSAVIGSELCDTFFNGFRPSIQQEMIVKLGGDFPNARIVDASDLLWRLRIIKTAAEIKAVAKACEITDRAYEETFSQVRGGMTEREVNSILISAMMKYGADLPFRGRKGPCAFVVLDTGITDGAPPMASDTKVLKEGCILRIDTGVVYRGYCSDFARSGVVGKATPEQQKGFDATCGKVARAVAGIKPGLNLGSIPVHWHGVGLDHVEAPFRGVTGQGAHGHLPIEADMVLSVEEFQRSEAGDCFHGEETVVVTKDGVDVLSKYPQRLYEFPTR